MMTKGSFCKLLKKVFGLKKDQAAQAVIESRIREGASVTGTNMYILILAILIASIGLNMNSTAVVIGAMLISPLMGPILSIGLGIAEQNFLWIRRASGKFAFQIAIGIVTSTVYFWLSPIESFSGELAARTNPTIWDVLIALFGGVAAIIANTRKNTMITVVPGAAIATALMPPLCTTGYCIATGKWIMAARAFYLFAINSIFICMAAIFVLRLEGISDKLKPETPIKKRVFMIVMVILIILPSASLARQSINETLMEENFKDFIKYEFNIENTQVVKSSINSETKIIEVALMGATVSDEKIKKIEDSMTNYDLDDFKLQLNQANYDEYISYKDIEEIIENKQESFIKDDVREELREAKAILEMYSVNELFEKETIEELMTLYPEIKEAGISEMHDKRGKVKSVLIINADVKYSTDDIKNMESWISEKFDRKIEILQAN